MPSVSAEYAVKDYELLQAELQSLRWRIIVVLLGSTFLTFFWFSSFLELIFKISFAGSFRFLILLPIVANACSWTVWLASVILPQFGFRRELFFDRGYSESAEDLHYLERIQVLQLRLRRLSYYSRLIQMMVALGFILIGIVTGFVLLGRI